MQTMDCRNFKEVLDSYLSDELAVETNHLIIRHTEHCADCRSEMAARRNLRGILRGAVRQAAFQKCVVKVIRRRFLNHGFHGLHGFLQKNDPTIRVIREIRGQNSSAFLTPFARPK